MKQMIYKVAAITAIILTSGCAQTSGYRPVVDPYSDSRSSFLQQDIAQCEQLAKDNSSVGKGVATDGITGALLGGAGGAAIGALMGNPATGAALGGTVGGLGGATKGGFQADETYKRVFRNCLRARGHNPLD
jgi:uncharacterized membrane protein YebE (DUF533 family)